VRDVAGWRLTGTRFDLEQGGPRRRRVHAGAVCA
jgi:hypothetical protein